MTYADLLKETAIKKQKALKELNSALRGPAGFLCKAEMESNMGAVAWLWLAKDFCEALSDHISEFIDQANGEITDELADIEQIYMAYEDDDPDLYDLLPVEAQLFTA